MLVAYFKVLFQYTLEESDKIKKKRKSIRTASKATEIQTRYLLNRSYCSTRLLDHLC